MNVLISLHKGYGLGDGVQVSSVLRHVVAARPEWRIDYQAEEGRHCVGRGIVRSAFAYGESYTVRYDAEVQIVLYDTWANWGDRPNTRVASCLHEQFGLGWDAGLARYQVEVDDESVAAASSLLYGWEMRDRKARGIDSGGKTTRSTKAVAVHYEGDSSPDKKNLTHSQIDDVCLAIKKIGYEPIILDWRARCPLPYHKIRTPAAWGKDAEMVCAVISQCVAFVGIDSGPAKCAAATATPSLVVWTGHHPAPFYDPAPNVTHLVPAGYHGLEPVCSNKAVIDFFEQHYNVLRYTRDPVEDINAWLQKTLTP